MLETVYSELNKEVNTNTSETPVVVAIRYYLTYYNGSLSYWKGELKVMIPEEWEIQEVTEQYGLDDFRALTLKERSEIYQRLTKAQRALIDAHRKYLVRSEFIKDSYLSASDWDFMDLKIDEEYPKSHNKQNMLYCECGRRLKYQYLVKSKASGKVMGLGIQHFKDHLNIPHQVASEIVQRLNNVDFALDELLWLKRRGVTFPHALWKQYAFVLYQNQYMEKTTPFNYELSQRFADFKEADMPIYVSDYQAVLKEIAQLRIVEPIQHDLYTKENFQQFEKGLNENIRKQSLFDHMSIWSSQIQKRLKTHPEKPMLPASYFEELYELLLIKDESKREKQLLIFANKGMGKWLQKEVYWHLLEKRQLHEMGLDFLNEVHPFIREGLMAFVYQQQKPKTELSNEIDTIKELLSKYDEATKKQILKELEESLYSYE